MMFDISYLLRYRPQNVERQQMIKAADEIDKLREQLKGRDEELLRIRTTQAAAAHSIDNIGVEGGLGARATPFEVEKYVRSLREKLKRAKEACRSALDTYEVQTEGQQPWVENEMMNRCVKGTWHNTPRLLKEVLDEQD